MARPPPRSGLARVGPPSRGRVLANQSRVSSMTPRPSRRSLIAASATALVAAPHVARAQTPIRWRMITSWTKNLPGPGVSAERLAQRINRMSGGRMLVEVFPAGSIVPAFGVFEAISTGVAEMGRTAVVLLGWKTAGRGAVHTAPFGLPPLEHQTWIEQRGGQQLWDELSPERRARPARGQHRPEHGRLVSQADHVARRSQRPAHPRAGIGRRSLCATRRHAAVDPARRHRAGARTRHHRRRRTARAGQ